METSLHRRLKVLYAGEEGETEARVGKYRIDAVIGKRLIEVQHAGLSSIRDKCRALLKKHELLVVKPIVARKTIVKLDGEGGQIVSRRKSPKRGTAIDLFHDLIHFTNVFPHKRLAIEAPLVEIEEYRRPGHGRRRRWRKNDFVVVDQRLVSIGETIRLATASDLNSLLPPTLPKIFDTADLAERLGVDRWVAQRVAYTLRETGAAKQVDKRGNAWLYKLQKQRRRKAA